MRQYPILERFWDPEENFEILNLKNAKNGLCQRLMEISISVKKNTSKAVKIKLITIK